MTEQLWLNLADGIPAVVVTLIFFLIAYLVILPIVKLIIDRFIPLADRVVLVLEVHGKSSQQLAEVLQKSLSDQRELFELHMKERLEEYAMLEKRIKTLEQLIEEKDKRIAALEEQIEELKKADKTKNSRIAELEKELETVKHERDDLKSRLEALEKVSSNDAKGK
jgi:septal ring factor EnvC (AmiA/AmiB activator)